MLTIVALVSFIATGYLYTSQRIANDSVFWLNFRLFQEPVNQSKARISLVSMSIGMFVTSWLFTSVEYGFVTFVMIVLFQVFLVVVAMILAHAMWQKELDAWRKTGLEEARQY